ncbi:hypothetical protein ABZW30_40355 [Kitasatospora sp. NPDC004669]|uniref:hypothetical protein n=1 Tax=Kitasatospora sp. NPDC004669 TaxID=3154555 RepID=UPI0033B168F2
MPSLLHYEIVTDPTSLRASLTDEPSLGTVYVIVSNTHQAEVKWDYIDVAMPLLNLSSDLTDNPSAVTASIERTYQNPLDDELEFAWDSGSNCFRAQLSRAQPPTRKHALLDGHGALVLKLENIPVSAGAGLSLLEIRDNAYGGDGNLARRDGHYTTHLGLVKQTPRVPRNFRAQKSLVNGDANEQLVLLWDGPTDLDYEILDQPGTAIHHERAVPGAAAAHKDYRWPTSAPKRGTTYTLVAKAPGAGQQQRGYFLTTTVHAVVPEFESGTRTPWVEGTAGKGRVTFATDGVEVHRPNGNLGRVTADDVITRVVQGLTDSAGWITFPDRGVNVYHGHGATLGVLTAARVDAEGVNTTWVGSREAGQGWIAFTQPGATLYKDDSGQERGTFTAEKVDVHGLNTTWVGDRDGGKGWLEFPQSGINVRKDGGGAWGNVAADKADLNGINTKWVQGPGTGDGWIEFPPEGVRVLRDGGHDLGTVIAGKANLHELHTVDARVSGEAHVQGLLTVGGGMKLSHDGERMFVTMPDRIIFHGINEFKKWVTLERGMAVSFQTGSVEITKENGVLFRGSDVQIQQGQLSISTGNPPQVRVL